METPKEIVEGNFKGLSDFIDDKDILEWYKQLIEVCIEQYSENLKEENDKLRSAMQGYVDRVQKGQDWTNYTYNKFKELLK